MKIGRIVFQGHPTEFGKICLIIVWWKHSVNPKTWYSVCTLTELCSILFTSLFENCWKIHSKRLERSPDWEAWVNLFQKCGGYFVVLSCSTFYRDFPTLKLSEWNVLDMLDSVTIGFLPSVIRITGWWFGEEWCLHCTLYHRRHPDNQSSKWIDSLQKFSMFCSLVKSFHHLCP